MMPQWDDTPPWDDIKAQHPLLEAVQSRGVKMKKAGTEWVGQCPFHQEKTPSFFVNPAKGKFHCQGCQARGDVIDFVQQIRGCSKSEAIQELTGGKVAALPEPVRRERDRLRIEAEQEEARRKEQGSNVAARRWAKAERVDPAHPYLIRKCIAETVDELLLARSEGADLLVPMYDADGEIQSVQAISAGGDKKFQAGAPSKLGRFLIGLNFGGRVVVCEGFATGVSIFMAWPEQICVTFSAGNMEAVARDLHARGVPILLAPDKDQMAHFSEVARELDCPVIGPDVDGAKADFNDEHLAHGMDHVLKTFMDGLRDHASRAEREKREAERENEPLDLWTKTPVPPFPESLLPPLIARFAKIRAEMIGCDPSGLAMAAIAACGAVITDRIKLRPKQHDAGWHESARLWVMLVGAPSTKKTPIISAATRRLAQIDGEMIRDHAQAMRDWDKDDGPPPVPRRLRVTDITPEQTAEICAANPDGVLSLQDELSAWFGGIEKYAGGKGSAKDRGFWLQAYNGGHYAVDRIQRKAAFVENLSVSILGGVQPEPMRRIMRDASDDGLIQRFLPVMLGDPKLGKDVEMPDVAAEYDGLVDALHAMSPPEGWLGVLTFSPEAQDLRNELEARHLTMTTSFEAINRKIASHIGKYDGMFARLCVIFHCIEHATLRGAGEPLGAVVGIDTAKRAEGFLHGFLRRHALAFYTNVGGLSDDHDILTDIGGHIIAQGKERVSLRDLGRGTRAMKRITEYEGHAIFEQLVAHGWLEEDSKRSDARAWKVNPAVHVLFADRAAVERERRERMRATVREMVGD